MPTAPWGLYGLVAALSGLWAVIEVLSAFEYAPGRALRTGGALLLVLINIGAACLVLALVLEILPTTRASLWTAVAVAFGWQTLIRAEFNLLQPLPGGTTEAVGVSLNDLYGRIQRFCRRQIDRSLAGDRVALLEEALKVEIEPLISRSRLLAHALITDQIEDFEAFLKRMDDRNLPLEERKLLLATYLLDNGGPDVLRAVLKREQAGKNK